MVTVEKLSVALTPEMAAMARDAVRRGKYVSASEVIRPVLRIDCVMTTTSLHISLPETLKEFVAERVRQGAFSNPSDYVRALIRADRERQARLEMLRAELRVGADELDRGLIAGDEVFRQLRERYGAEP